jgi:hypothetical protein
MFKYLAVISLTPAVEKNFKQQMGKDCRYFKYNHCHIDPSLSDYLEAYLRETIQSAEFADYMDNAEIKCDVEFDGASHYKWICILVSMIKT